MESWMKRVIVFLVSVFLFIHLNPSAAHIDAIHTAVYVDGTHIKTESFTSEEISLVWNAVNAIEDYSVSIQTDQQRNLVVRTKEDLCSVFKAVKALSISFEKVATKKKSNSAAGGDQKAFTFFSY